MKNWSKNLKIGIFTTLASVAMIVILAGCFFLIPRGAVDDEKAFRNRPKAPNSYVDQNVVNTGNAMWQSPEYQAMAQQELALTNQQRAAAGLPALAWDNNLAGCAMIRCSELPQNFSHTRPNGTDWYTLNPNIMYGEKLAHGYTSAGDVNGGWMASPMHRENIMTPGFTKVGIGVYNAGGTINWVQEFGY